MTHLLPRALPRTLPRRRFAASLAARASMLFVLGALAIQPACGRPAPGGVVIFTASSPELAMASIDPETGSWESAPWSPADTGWIPYPPRGQVQLEHRLGREPRTVLVYLSFDRAGTSPALAAGDLARVIDVDESTITIWNDTNGSYFARVVLR